jgi:NAD(P)-dependent dehydrogenase (short-subunit alcohol dehydrogenase family)
MELHGKVALVTGGAVRLGRAMASALAGEGMRLVVHYNSSRAPADELVDEIRKAGGEAVAIGADLARGGEVERLAREAVAAFGGVDVLVNSASVFPPEALEETDEALWDHTMAVNLKAPFFLIRHLAPTLRERRGIVVNMVDLAGMQAWARYAAHGISKAGIAPGAVLPPDDTYDAELERLANTAALRRLGSPDDVVGALLYLLRADFVTGEILVVDGGRRLRG